MGIKISGADALLFSDGAPVIAKSCDIYVEGGHIASVGSAPEGFQCARVIDGRHRLCVPGLVNCHTHVYMTLMRNVADDLAFHDWLMGRVMPIEDTLTPEDGYWGSLLGCMEMLRGGTTCFLDMHMFPGQSVRAARESGMRAVISRGLTGGGSDEGGARRLREALEEMDEFRAEPRVTFMLAPHAVYTCDEAYLRQIAGVAKERGVGIHVHVSESRKEVADSQALHGCSPVALLERLGLFDGRCVAAHCVHVSEEDIEILARRGVNVASNPVSNMKLGNGFAPVPKLLERGVRVCLGTDGAAGNNALNLFREMSMVTLIHKGALEEAQAVSAAQAVCMATLDGARALGLDAGEIAPGKKADLALLRTDTPAFQPENNPLSALAYAATGAETDTVLVDGGVVVEHGTCVHVDEERVYFEVNRIAKKFGRA